MRRNLAWLVPLLAALPACEFYFGGGDDDCLYGGGEGDRAAEAPAGLRNPETGACEYYGGGGYPCDSACGPCPDVPAGAEADAIAIPSWGFCESFCTGLDEATCQATTGCRAIYVDSCPAGGDCAPGVAVNYAECWATDQTGPIQGGGCAGLDSYTCSQHDDCSAVHAQADGCVYGDPADPAGAPIYLCPPGWFTSCIDEAPAAPGCYSDAECAAGTHCNADEVCLPPPGCAGGATPGESDEPLAPCPDVCYGECVPGDPVDPGTCDGAVLCDSLPPACPDGTVPGIKDGCWSGYCIPLEECRPERGSCTGDVFCDLAPPVCGPGATPGIKDGCYTGHCIPLAECEMVDCATLTDEASCVARAECVPLYAGIDCTCGADGSCTCADWIFTACTYALPTDGA